MSDEVIVEKPTKKKDKVVIGLIVCILLVAIIGVAVNETTQKKEKYLVNFQLAEILILGSVISSVELCEIYSDTWSDAIDRRRNFSDAVNSKIAVNSSKITDLEEQKEVIDKLMKELNNPPNEFKKAHDKLLEIYGIYTQLYSQAKGPSGSLMTFNQNVNKLQEDFLRANHELGILVPD